MQPPRIIINCTGNADAQQKNILPAVTNKLRLLGFFFLIYFIITGKHFLTVFFIPPPQACCVPGVSPEGMESSSVASASSEAGSSRSQEIEELERFIDSYVLEYQVQGLLTDKTEGDGESEKTQSHVSQVGGRGAGGTLGACRLGQGCQGCVMSAEVAFAGFGCEAGCDNVQGLGQLACLEVCLRSPACWEQSPDC